MLMTEKGRGRDSGLYCYPPRAPRFLNPCLMRVDAAKPWNMFSMTDSAILFSSALKTQLSQQVLQFNFNKKKFQNRTVSNFFRQWNHSNKND